MTKLGLLANLLWGVSYVLFACALTMFGFLLFYLMLGTYFKITIFTFAPTVIPLLIGLVLYKTAKIILTKIDDSARIGSEELDPNIGDIQLTVGKKEPKLNDNGILEIKPKADAET